MSAPLTTDQRNALTTLLDAWPDRQIVMIGASAIACQLSMTRQTHDLDLVVAVDVASANIVLRKLGFERAAKIEHRWTRQGAVLDVLPVSASDIARGTVHWPESDFSMNVCGFDLLSTHRRSIVIDAKHSIDVATIPALVILKASAWLDRPHERVRDLRDIGYVLSEYLDDADERRWTDERLQDVSFDEQSAFALGIDLASVMKAAHRGLLEKFLGHFRDSDTYEVRQLAADGRTAGRDRVEVLEARLAALRAGLAAS